MRRRLGFALLAVMLLSGCDDHSGNASGPGDIDFSQANSTESSVQPDDPPASNLSDQLNSEMSDAANASILIGAAQGGSDPDGGEQPEPPVR
jgi:hypothetical protein